MLGKIFLVAGLASILIYTPIAACNQHLAKEETNQVFTPESILPAGVDSTVTVNPYTGKSGNTRKGTVAATLNNIAILNQQLLKDPLQQNQQKIQQLTEAIVTLLPSLQVIGIFDLFTPEEWIQSTNQPGRTLTAILYLQHYPEAMTPTFKEKLQEISNKTKITLLKSEIHKLLKDETY